MQLIENKRPLDLEIKVSLNEIIRLFAILAGTTGTVMEVMRWRENARTRERNAVLKWLNTPKKTVEHPSVRAFDELIQKKKNHCSLYNQTHAPKTTR